MEGLDLSLRYEYGGPPAVPTRDKIVQLEGALRALPDAMGAAEMEDKYNEHHFAPGVYVRVMKVPAGMCVVGKTHRHACVNVLVSGTMRVVSEFGEETMTGPRTWVGEPGIKRAGYALTDVEWINIHPNPTDTQDLRLIEEQVIAPDYDMLEHSGTLVIEPGE
jgi:hypothetical protein